MHPGLEAELRALADQVVRVSEVLLELAGHLTSLSRASFAGEEAERVLEGTKQLSEGEWKADRLQRKLARHCYALEDLLDTMDLVFYERICTTLSAIANKAENAGKFLHVLIAHR